MSETTTFITLVELLISILAVIGGLFGGLPRLLRPLTLPKIIIKDCIVQRVQVREQKAADPLLIDNGNKIGLLKTELSWHLFNVPKLFVFGGDAKGIITTWNLDSDEKEGWAYSDDTEPIPLIPKEKDWHQRVRRTFEVPEGDYTLTLHVTMRGDTIGVHSEKISIPKKGFLSRLKV